MHPRPAVGGVSGQTHKEGTSPNISYKISQGLPFLNRYFDLKAGVLYDLTQRRPVFDVCAVRSDTHSFCRWHRKSCSERQM